MSDTSDTPGAETPATAADAAAPPTAALDKKKPVLVYCAGGFRSRKAVLKLKELGFQNIQHIHRGYLSWKPDSQA